MTRSGTVLIIGNEPYWERWEGRNPPTEGAGVAREADALHGLFDADQQAFQRKVIIVLLPGESDAAVPHPRYPVTSLTADGIEALLRRLHDRPKYPRAAIGQPPPLPAARVGVQKRRRAAAIALVVLAVLTGGAVWVFFDTGEKWAATSPPLFAPVPTETSPPSTTPSTGRLDTSVVPTTSTVAATTTATTTVPPTTAPPTPAAPEPTPRLRRQDN